VGIGLNHAALVFASLLLCGCLGSIGPAISENVKVAPLDDAVDDTSQAATPGISRTELQQAVMRFADRYGGRMVLVADRLLEQAQDGDQRWLATSWKMASRGTAVAIAVGPNAVINLLDMLVLASLTRLQVDSYWVPVVIGEEQGKDLREAARLLEQDIWSIADEVLTEAQQQELRAMIRQWQADHPDNHYFWSVRFAEFSGQHATSLTEIVQGGGLLDQVQQAREVVDEVRDLGDRVLYYMQHAAALTRHQVLAGSFELLRQPELQGLFRDADSLSTSIDRLVDVAEALPEMRLAAINQFMDQLTVQRRGLMDDLFSAEARVRLLLVDLQQTMTLGSELAEAVDNIVQNADRLANKLGRGAEQEETQRFDIKDYRRFISDAGDTAEKLNHLLQSLERLTAMETGAEAGLGQGALLDALDSRIEDLILRLFIFTALLILLFFTLLFGYRYAILRLGLAQ